MEPLLYRELVPWYRLLTPPEEYAEEAASYQASFERAVTSPRETLLELGAGAGHNAYYLKRAFRCVLTDLSDEMLSLSRELNPECEHLVGDMRTLRLGRTFDMVLVHDAVMYMTTEEDLLAAARTAFVHTRPGGAALFAPDCLKETFHEGTDVHGSDGEGRAVRCLEWSWDPDPSDDTFITEYTFLLRDGDQVKAVHDRHVEGLFSRATWLRILTSTGYKVEAVERPIGDGETDEIFLCRKL
jgi:SAM-dependent methyltransferase